MLSVTRMRNPYRLISPSVSPSSDRVVSRPRPSISASIVSCSSISSMANIASHLCSTYMRSMLPKTVSKPVMRVANICTILIAIRAQTPKYWLRSAPLSCFPASSTNQMAGTARAIKIRTKPKNRMDVPLRTDRTRLGCVSGEIDLRLSVIDQLREADRWRIVIAR